MSSGIEIRTLYVGTAVIRTSDTVITITLPAVATYAIGGDEVIDLTVPASYLVTTAAPVTATPTLTITNTVPTPTITSVTADDPDDGDVVYGDGDTITFVFSEATNQAFGPGLDSGNLDTLFGAMGLGTDYTGLWSDASTFEITINDAAGGTAPTIDIDTFTLQIAGGLKNAAATSLVSTGSSAAITGDWGTLTIPGPTVATLIGADPDDADAIYSIGDTITVGFSVTTNEPAAATKAEIDAIFSFSESLGADYTGSWSAADTLVITVVDDTGATPPTIGGLTVTYQPGNGVKNADFTSLESAGTSAAITGDWGQLAVQVNEGDAIIRNNLINPERGEYAVITFNLKKSTKVNITVYDLAGKPVDVLYNRTASAGFNHVRWYGKNKRGRKVGPGIYYVVIMLGKERHVEKVLVVK